MCRLCIKFVTSVTKRAVVTKRAATGPFFWSVQGGTTNCIHMHKTSHACRLTYTHTHAHTHARTHARTNQQLCPFCVDTIEDKCHVLFLCLLYSQLRSKFHLPLYRGLPRKERYSRLCSDSDDYKFLNVSSFIFFALTLRESLID